MDRSNDDHEETTVRDCHYGYGQSRDHDRGQSRDHDHSHDDDRDLGTGHFRYQLLKWIWDSANAFVGGVSSGILVVLTSGSINMIAPRTIAVLSGRQFTVVCLVSGAVSWAMYVKERRLPPIWEQ